MHSIFDVIGNDTPILDDTGYKKELQVTPSSQRKPSVQSSRELIGGWSASKAHANIVDDNFSIFNEIGSSY